MTDKILCGTCGYDYPEWKGIFYPQNLAREDFLSYYATQFNSLEINNTFYRMPTEYQLRNMVKKSEGKIQFSIKAPKIFTHEISPKWKDSVPVLKEALLPVINADVLSSVLFQFPQSFHYTPTNRIYLANLVQLFTGFPLVIEFRHQEWFHESVFEGLKKRNCSICICDMPMLKYLPKQVPVITGNIGYMRFHGRKKQNWYENSGTNGRERYHYMYTKKELCDSVEFIKILATKTKYVQIFFNNHPEGDAAVNALMLKSLLLL